MKIIKKVLIIVAIIIAIPLIVALFVKKEYGIEREIKINKPKQIVFDYIKYLKNQACYSAWAMKDTNSKMTFKGTDGEVGFISAWESKDKDVGVGEQEIIKIVNGERIDSKLRFKKPYEAEDDAYMTTISIDSTTTKVIWGFKGAFPYPMNIMGLFINMDKEVGGDLEKGLINLRNLLEKQQ